MKLLYVRFGEIPANGKSKNYLTGEYEKGVSVYEALERDEKISILLPNLTGSACVSLSGVLDRPMYIVDGELCGTFSNVRSAVLGIIALKHVESDKEVYLGNDRNIHSEINKAFPIYKLNKLVEGEEVYMVNIYGAWNVIDKHFNLSYVDLKALGVKSTDWIKI